MVNYKVEDFSVDKVFSIGHTILDLHCIHVNSTILTLTMVDSNHKLKIFTFDKIFFLATQCLIYIVSMSIPPF